jgi:uncharacterized protein DUF4232
MRPSASAWSRVLAVAGLLTATLLATTSAASSSPAVPRAKQCEPGDVEIVLGRAGAGLGHWGVPLVILDPGGRACTFTGYPTVSAYVATTRRWVRARKTIEGYLGGLNGPSQHVRRIEIGFDEVASAMLEGTDVPVGGATTCPTYVRIEVALPGWPRSANLALGTPACSVPEVHPVVLGATGQQPPSS